MATASADYEAAVRALRAQTLPAFVEYTQEGEAYGIAGWHGAPQRVVVDVHAKKIVSVTPHDDKWNEFADESPVTKHVFDPTCYAATNEHLVNWNGQTALAIAVKHAKSCKEDIDVNTIYADESTLDLLGADGSETDEDMTVDFSVHYAHFGTYIVPSSISAHAHGHGWLFWARERAEVRYSNYTFTNARRQSDSTSGGVE